MVDRADDVKTGIKTSALTFGKYDVAAVMFCYGGLLAILLAVGVHLHLKWPYYLGLATMAGLMAYHYTLIKNREPEKCFQAFLHNNWVGAAIFAGIALGYWV